MSCVALDTICYDECISVAFMIWAPLFSLPGQMENPAGSYRGAGRNSLSCSSVKLRKLYFLHCLETHLCFPALTRPPKHHLFISSQPSGESSILPIYSEGKDAYSASISSWKFAGMAGTMNSPFISQLQPCFPARVRGLIGFLSSTLGCTKVLQISVAPSNRKLSFPSFN